MAQYEKFTDLVKDIASWKDSFSIDKKEIVNAAATAKGDAATANAAAETASEAAERAENAAINMLPDATTAQKGFVQLADANAKNLGDSARAITAAEYKELATAIESAITEGAPEATETIKGISRLATTAEIEEGSAMDAIPRVGQVTNMLDTRMDSLPGKVDTDTPYADNEKYTTAQYNYNMTLNMIPSVSKMAMYTKDLGIISANESISLPNEYGSDVLQCIVEIQVNGIWAATGDYTDNGKSYFVRAAQYGDNSIHINTGNSGLDITSSLSGSPHSLAVGEAITSAPARLRVLAMADGSLSGTLLDLYDYVIYENVPFDNIVYFETAAKYVAASYQIGLIAYAGTPSEARPWATLSKSIKQLQNGAGVLVANMGTHIEYSTNITDWTVISSTLGTITALTFDEDSGKYLALDTATSPAQLLTSTDGIDFSREDAAILNDADFVTSKLIYAGNGKVIAVAENSTDIVVIDTSGTEAVLTKLTTPLEKVIDIAYGNGVHILLGTNPDGTCVALSVDLAEFTLSTNFKLPANEDNRNIAYGKGTFIIADFNEIKYYKSTDGLTWGGYTYE